LTQRGEAKVDSSSFKSSSELNIFVEMPDALSKTIPIWCTIINRALFPESIEHHKLYTSPQVISLSEHSQIESALNGFLKSFLDLDRDLEVLRSQISKPLRPLWITPETQFANGPLMFTDYHTIICCTASKQVPSSEASESSYVQGSGDDTENWACGLIPTIFWANRQLLLATDEFDLPSVISKLVATSSASSVIVEMSPIAPTSSLYVATLSTMLLQPIESRNIAILLFPNVTEQSTWQISPNELKIGLGPHKLGSRNLRIALPHIVTFVATHLAEVGWKEAGSVNLITACSSGKDFSVGVALTILCLFVDDRGQFKEADVSKAIDKTFIRRRLGWIMTALPDANPSRATLQSVNSYLMDRPGY
jgi:tRNA A64-2'-O-ribosylphosphate transferase